MSTRVHRIRHGAAPLVAEDHFDNESDEPFSELGLLLAQRLDACLAGPAQPGVGETDSNRIRSQGDLFNGLPEAGLPTYVPAFTSTTSWGAASLMPAGLTRM